MIYRIINKQGRSVLRLKSKNSIKKEFPSYEEGICWETITARDYDRGGLVGLSRNKMIRTPRNNHPELREHGFIEDFGHPDLYIRRIFPGTKVPLAGWPSELKFDVKQGKIPGLSLIFDGMQLRLKVVPFSGAAYERRTKWMLVRSSDIKYDPEEMYLVRVEWMRLCEGMNQRQHNFKEDWILVREEYWHANRVEPKRDTV
jgi:hypothetical protein